LILSWATMRSMGTGGNCLALFLKLNYNVDFFSSGNNGKNPYFGAICGRVANRIANGAFTLDGKKYSLAKNNGPNSLHGGVTGYDKVMWDAFINLDGSVTFTYLSKDGEEGYPGDVTLNVTYTLTEENGLELSILGVTTKATPINIANHAYFNLGT
jgi:aldose 1-epimerase